MGGQRLEERRNPVGAAGEVHHRFDYRGMHRYLITLPVFPSKTIFTSGDTVLKVLAILRDACRTHQFDVYAYCFLPQQLVMIARGKTHQSQMKDFLSMFRSASSDALRPVLHHPLWGARYFERVLRKTERNRDIASRIFRLPLKAGLASRPEDYPFQGSFVRSLPFS